MENILIDTDVAIDYLRSREKASTVLVQLYKRHALFLSSITEFELFLGARTEKHFEDLEILFDELDVLPFDLGCGRIAADIWKDIQNKHQHAEIKDIFIASIALRNNVRLCTFNKKHFKAIKGVRLLDEQWMFLS